MYTFSFFKLFKFLNFLNFQSSAIDFADFLKLNLSFFDFLIFEPFKVELACSGQYFWKMEFELQIWVLCAFLAQVVLGLSFPYFSLILDHAAVILDYFHFWVP